MAQDVVPSVYPNELEMRFSSSLGLSVHVQEDMCNWLNDSVDAYALATIGPWMKSGEINRAKEWFREEISVSRSRLAILISFGRFLAAIDSLREASEAFDQALQLDPKNIDLWLELAAVQQASGRLEAAEISYRRALELEQNCATGWTRLGEILRAANRREEALVTQRQALDCQPDHAEAWHNLAMLLVDLDRLDAAINAFCRALEYRQNFTVASSNLLFSMGFALVWSPATMREQATRLSRVWALGPEKEISERPTFSRPPVNERPLRLGVLSSELGHHAVGFFLWPWLSELDSSVCELFLYPTRLRPEAEAKKFKGLAAHWVPLVGLSDMDAAERIRQDNIDVLVETSGHTQHNRLGIVVHRVAPIQCHYIGYFATTGLAEMDYFIGDAIFVPPAQDSGFSERVWRLPRTRYAFEPLASAPDPCWRPDPKGRLWLGSFNQLNKVREESLKLWSGILRAQPNTHLLLKDKSADDPAIQARILSKLMHLGISSDRVMFVGRTPLWSEHMGLYNHVDLALDPVPFTSATTAFEALWMGTPMVTLIGEQPASRQAASMLHGLGRDCWIAVDAEDYVNTALGLLRDVDERQRLRLGLREEMCASELCDGPGLASVLVDAFTQMFENWRSKHLSW